MPLATFARRAPLASAGSPLPPSGESCEGESFVCLGATLLACEPTPRVVGTCAKSCDLGARVVDGSGLSDVQALALLCTR